MFFAINSETNEKVNSLTVEENPSYNLIEEDVWYADPDEIESCPKEIDITKIKVKFRKGKKEVINWNGTKYAISPHFFIPNKSKQGINVIPESKEHKLAKNWIYNKLKQERLLINYSEVNKPYKYNNQLNLFELPIDKEKIGIEVNVKEVTIRRADVICPFKIKHDILGNGIVFEIQFSRQKQTTKVLRELDWAIRGYSVAWLFPEDFDQITEMLIETKKESINIDSFANLIKKNKKEFIKDLKYIVKEECRKLDEKKEQIINDITKAKLNSSQINKTEIMNLTKEYLESFKNKLQPTCPRCNLKMVLRGGDYGKFWGCVNYPNCKVTSQYEED